MGKAVCTDQQTPGEGRVFPDSLGGMIVLLLVVDSLRADAPSFAGGPAATPHLDRLAAEGVSFDRSWASAGWTVPSLVSLVTGTFAHRVGVSRWRHAFPARRPTLMSAFAASGFDVLSFAHNPRWFLAPMGFRGVVGDSQDAAAVRRALRGPAGRDRLVIVHHWWTHLPYQQQRIPRNPWRTLCGEAIHELARDPGSARPRQRQRYHDAVAWFDAHLLGDYLDAALAGSGDVLVAVTGDHGENWGESLPPGETMQHIYDLHGRWLTDATTAVPLVLWGRGARGALPAAVRRGGYARGVDLAPTLCELAGVPWPGPPGAAEGPTLVDRGIGPGGGGLVLDGRSLVATALDGAPSPVGEAMTVTSHNAVVPARYPVSARRLWHRFALRRDEGRWQWDAGQAGRSRVWTEEQGQLRAMSRGRQISRLFAGRAPWAPLVEEREGAVGPAVRLDASAFGVTEDEDDALAGDMGSAGERDLAVAMRTAGYMD